MTNAVTLPYPLNMLYDAYKEADRKVPGLDSDRQKGLDYILENAIGDRDREILRMRYQDHMTLEEVASYYGLTRERIRGLEQRALHRLGQPGAIAYVEDGYMIASGEVDRIAKARVEAALGRAITEVEQKAREIENHANVKLCGLRLQQRTENALRRHGIETVPQLMEADEREMMSWSGFGNACLVDVQRAKDRIIRGEL